MRIKDLQLEDFVRNLVPIEALSPKYQNEIIKHVQVREYRKGRYVFKQGDKDNSCFYLLEGELEMSSDGQVVRKVTGGSDTARYALAQLQPRQLSAKAKQELSLSPGKLPYQSATCC